MEKRVRGAFVVLVGPDGVGKTTVAQLLLEGLQPSGRYFHFCPPLFGRWGSGPEPGLVNEKAQDHPPRSRRTTGWLRIARRFVIYWGGYLTSIRPATRAGRLVIADRWAYGYAADPSSLRYFGPKWLATAMIRLLPSPDLVACLVAPPAVIRQRKAELPIGEIDRQLRAWKSIPARNIFEMDALSTPDRLVETIRRRIQDTLH